MGPPDPWGMWFLEWDNRPLLIVLWGQQLTVVASMLSQVGKEVHWNACIYQITTDVYPRRTLPRSGSNREIYYLNGESPGAGPHTAPTVNVYSPDHERTDINPSETEDLGKYNFKPNLRSVTGIKHSVYVARVRTMRAGGEGGSCPFSLKSGEGSPFPPSPTNCCMPYYWDWNLSPSLISILWCHCKSGVCKTCRVIKYCFI